MLFVLDLNAEYDFSNDEYVWVWNRSKMKMKKVHHLS